AALAESGARVDDIVRAAAVGREVLVRSFIEVGQRDGRLHAPFAPGDDPRLAMELALVFAAMCNQRGAVEALLDAGVDINATPPGSHVTATALHTAAWQGHLGMVQLLLDRGADPTIEDGRHHSSAAGWAQHAGHAAVAAALRPAGE
ncbi:MAG: ankyrin repeat domain-containing protein, partial [Actinomycetota bacterium]